MKNMATRAFSKKKILVIVVAVIVLFAGLGIAYVVMSRNIGKDQVAQSESPANVNDALLDFVNTFYKAYYMEPTGNETMATVASAALERYGTANAIGTFTAQQKLCFQNSPGSVTADDVASLQNPFKVNVTYNFIEDPTTAVVTVVNQDGTLKIDAMTCG